MQRLREIHFGQCQEVTGEDRTAPFLRSLMRWYQYTKVKHGGQKWVSLTRAQWCAELHLTSQQFRLVLEKMKAKGLIVCEQHLFKGITPLFVRPSQKCLELLLNGPQHPAKDGAKAPAQAGSKHPTPLKPLNKPEEETKAANGSAVATPDKVCIQKASGNQDEVGNVIAFPIGQGGPDMPMTVADVMAEQLAKAAAYSLNTLKPDTITTLVAVWHTAFQKLGKVAPLVTQKMRGQLKHLIKTWPEGQAPAILAFALENWFDVTFSAEKQGAFKSPDHPEIGYLVKYQHVAVTLFIKSKMKAAPKTSVSPPPKVVQSIAQPEKDKPITMAELQAMEAEEEAKAAA